MILALALVMSLSIAQNKTFNFSKRQIKIGAQILEVEIADTHELQQRGLMFRDKLAPNKGMLFVYPRSQEMNFWMKNTFIPLDIGFFSNNKKLLEIHSMKATASVMQQEVDRVQSRQKAMYALEVNEGWFKKNKIKPGQKFEFLPEITDHGRDKTSP